MSGGISPSKLSQTCSHTKLVGLHTALPSIGNPYRIAISYRVIDISQVGKWNVWVSGYHRSTKEVTRLQSISICGRRVTRYNLHWCKYGVIRSPNCRGGANGWGHTRKVETWFKKKYIYIYIYIQCYIVNVEIILM